MICPYFVGLQSGTVFEGTSGVYEHICRFQFQMNKKGKSNMRTRDEFQENPFACSLAH